MKTPNLKLEHQILQSILSVVHQLNIFVIVFPKVFNKYTFFLSLNHSRNLLYECTVYTNIGKKIWYFKTMYSFVG